MTINHSIPKYITLDRLGEPILVSARQSKIAKRDIIKLAPDKVELIVANNNFKQAYNFLLSKEFAIRKKLASFPQLPPTPTDILTIFGINHQLKHIDSFKESIQIHNNEIIVYSSIARKDQLLKQYLIELLILKIQGIIQPLSRQENVSYSQIKISNAKSKWGSCSNHGVLSFNWRLAFVPLEILYYVIVHEMCHLTEMNHSNRFWDLVANLCPDYKANKLWLKENSYRLHQINC